MPKDEVRDIARAEAEIGLAYFARAFNVCDNPDLPYQWSPMVLDRFKDLAVQLINLVEEGGIDPREGSAAQDDRDFQRFIAQIVGDISKE